MLSDSAIPGEKPNYPYPTLIRAAILGSPRRALTLQGIYRALQDRFQWFRDHGNDRAWQNSIRHNLSLNNVFRRLAKPITEPGKGSYWTVDLAAGEGNKRERKRTKRSGRTQYNQRTTQADAPSTSRYAAKENSSSEEEGDGQFRRPSHSQSLPTTPYLSRPMYNPPHVDPALLQGHFVGQGRMLPPRSPRLGPAPYARSAFPMPAPMSSLQDSHFPALGHFSVRPGQTTTFGNPTFGHGPSGFDAWEASFMAGPPAGPPTWGTQASPSPIFDMPFPHAGPSHTPDIGYSPQIPAQNTRGRSNRPMTSPATMAAGASSAAMGVQSNTPIYHRGSIAVSAETVGSATGTSSQSSVSETSSVHNVAGPSVLRVYKRESSSSGSSQEL
ncbi:hypothetical protein EVJ58_g10830 [Rhodofomes roseus]|uniref:Fork-head domain-containing protein n=1 Tax=Rhodofomes roseus TaxID=34475 RepID=A0A4Y9XLI8_9APHY|nr:hypothetical protein EVJ58_g10830 [Rhodofomes roseus]